MDRIIGYLMDSLMRIGMHECMNVIVVADHGMANRTCEQLYVLNNVSVLKHGAEKYAIYTIR